jgi:hypothetical protein
MADFVYQNYKTRCQGWVNPSNLSYGPEISGLSSYQSPAGSSTVVVIYGSNFFSYSTIRFGTFTPTVYFVNSNILQFYVPNTLNSGTFTVQVCNGSVCSNSVNYTIDNASGYWLLNGGNITNTNNTSSGGVIVSWLSRGAPVTINSTDYPVSNPYPVPTNVNWIICDTTSGDVYITLPNILEYTGREVMIKRLGSNSVISSTINITSFDNLSTTNIIMNSTSPSSNYSWVTLVFNGANWLTMQCALI